MIPPKMEFGEGAGDTAVERWVLHPMWQQEPDQAPLWCPPAPSCLVLHRRADGGSPFSAAR